MARILLTPNYVARSTITKFPKIALCGLVACGLLGLGGTLLMNQTALAKQMDALQLLPRPQRFTELYFADAQKLPGTYVSGSQQQVQFITHNLEHQPVTYHYKIIAVASGSTTGEPLGDGVFSLVPDEYRTTTQTFTAPAPGIHTAITIVLDHKDVSQSLHFWVSITKPGATHATP